MRSALSGGLKSGLIAGLLVACRDIPLDAFRLDLHDPVAFARGAGLVLGIYLLIGLVLGAVIGLLLSLLALPLGRVSGGLAGTAARLALLAVGGVILGASTGDGEAVAQTWFTVGTLVVLIEAGRRAELFGLSGPAVRWLPAALALLFADALFFGMKRIIVERRSGAGIGLAWLDLGAVLAAAVAGYLLFALLAWLSRRAEARGGSARPGVVVGTLLLVVIGGLAAWQLIVGPSGLGAELARTRKVLSARASSGSPNVILISIDALRGDFPGYAGGPAKTPAMDALADESYVFERAYSVAPWTRPSFAAFFSSRYPSEMGVGRTRGASEGDPNFYPVAWETASETFPEVLRAAGYATAAVMTNGNLTHDAHADQGFEFFYHCSLHPGVGLLQLATKPLGVNPFSWENLERAPRVLSQEQRLLPALKARPALLWVHFMDPHQPYNPPTIPRSDWAETTIYTMANADASAAPVRRKFVAAYTAEIEYCDQSLTKLIRALKADGLWDSSIVVFWSDHGEEFWEHGGVDHGQSLFDEQLHVPLMIHVPGQTQGQRVTAPVSLLDVMPTVLDLCGQGTPQGCHGRSLTPLLREVPGQMPPFRMFMEGTRRGGIRKGRFDGRYKLIYDLYHDSFSLYDLQADPRELHDIYVLPQAPDSAAWESELAAWTDYTLALMDRRAGAGAVEVPEEIRQQLRDMGYVN